MDIKLNSRFSGILIALVFGIDLFGLPFISWIIDIFQPDNGYNISMFKLVMANLTMVAKLDRIIIGFWFYVNAKKFHLDKWTWLLIGLIYGQYGLLLFGIIMIIQKISSPIDLFKSLRPILIILMILIFLTFFNSFYTNLFFMEKLNTISISFIFDYSRYLSYSFVVIGIIMNIVFAIKLRNWIRLLKMNTNKIWIIATLFFGLFTIILFNEFTIIHKIKD